MVIAKIEKREALVDLENIVEAADGVMVARGDLGVEIDVAETPVAQKRIIAVCREKLKPVIVATQMLEACTRIDDQRAPKRPMWPTPFWMERNACMLSGETAIGQFPVLTVDTMNRIMVRTEEMYRDHPTLGRSRLFDRVHPVTSAVTNAAASIADDIKPSWLWLSRVPAGLLGSSPSNATLFPRWA